MIETGKAGLSAPQTGTSCSELNVNPEWLESGKGNMFNAGTRPDGFYMHRTDNSLPLQSVPPTDRGHGGLVPLFADQAQETREFHPIPNLPKCDGAPIS